MRIGVLADIHGNIYAFEKVWSALRKESCDLFFFLGDICGYYYYQNDILEVIRDTKNMISIMGNHDDIFLKIMENNFPENEYEQRHGKSCSVLKKNITPDNLAFLKTLPQAYELDQHNLVAYHGSPWDKLNGYVYPTDSLERFRELPYKYILMGHTHYPMIQTISHMKIVNPGSCGQPRDYNHPSYAVIDTMPENIEIKRVEYNSEPMVKDIMMHGEDNSYLIDVLKRRKRMS